MKSFGSSAPQESGRRTLGIVVRLAAVAGLAGAPSQRAKTIRPVGFCRAPVTITGTRSPIRWRAPSTTTMVPSSR